MGTPYYVNLTGASNSTLFQAYCLNPPSDNLIPVTLDHALIQTLRA
jgi:hypothetical protein